jgi:hypothetical protein
MYMRWMLLLCIWAPATLSAQTPVQQGAAGERMVVGADSSVLGLRLRSAVKKQVTEELRDPSSLQDFAITRVNARMVRDSLAPGFACGVYNARNGYGGYAGRSCFVVRLEGARTSPATALPGPVLTSEDNSRHRDACFDFPPEMAPWVANLTTKDVFRNGCLASRRIADESRKVFWVLADALKEGFTRAKAPGC